MAKKLIALRVPEKLYNLLKKQSELLFYNNFTETVIHYLKLGILNEITSNRLSLNEITSNRLSFLIDEQRRRMRKLIYDKRRLVAHLLRNKKIDELVLERDERKCRKCGSDKNITVYEITSEITEREGCEGKITLCEKCIKGLEENIPERYKLKAFLDWFFED